MNSTIFVIGGCRSGKSRHALALAEKQAPNNRCYVATCVPADDEMRQRVLRHQHERDASWYTVEEACELTSVLLENEARANVILVDCLTLWLTNLIMKEFGEQEIVREADALAKTVSVLQCPVILVSNEVGTGIVPESKLGRHFRDMAGLVNQRMAACADTVKWMVAGIPVLIKESGRQ